MVTPLSQILNRMGADNGSSVTMMSQKWRTVRIRGELIPPLEELVEKTKDQYGIPLFSSVSEAVSQAVKELLSKHVSKESSGS